MLQIFHQPAPLDPSETERHPGFTGAQNPLLECIRITMAAERHLVARAEPCPDHQACRRLAFARWLRLTERLTDDLDS
jgi:hypothetical protein